MLERPTVSDEAIRSRVRRGYGLPVADIEFLPIGNDSGAWAYRVDVEGGHGYFLKVRRGAPYEPSLTVPRHLADEPQFSAGDPVQIVAPLPALSGALWCELGDFSVMLYPFIDGSTGTVRGLSPAQWEALGRAEAQIHDARLPSALLAQVRREDFVPPWAGTVRALQARIDEGGLMDASQTSLAAFWQPREDEIAGLVARAEALGQMLQRTTPEFVLCHSDLHTANVLVDGAGRLFIVDWDAPVMAPRERDLMFVAGMGAGAEPAFFRGYGRMDVDPLALAYYRYEWVVQEIGDWGERVFFLEGVGRETREAAVRGFRELFQPGDVVESAYQSERMLPAALRRGEPA